MIELEEHKAHRYKLSFGIITVSSTRTPQNDETGKLIRDIVTGEGFTVTFYTIVKDNVAQIRNAFFIGIKNADVLIFNGGTGISLYDLTPEALVPYLKIIVGFGEAFRNISYGDIGSSSILSRAFAGVYGKNMVFALPGSPKACELALRKLIIPEVHHIYYEITKERTNQI